MDIERGPATEENPTRSSRTRVIVFAGVVMILFLIGTQIDAGHEIERLKSFIRGLGPVGPAAFVAIYVVATVTAMPGSILSIVAGVLFGTLWGTVIISIGSTLGAAASFLIARYIARDAVRQWLSGKPAFQRLETLSANRAALIVGITRLVPLFPFNLLNYGFGLTNIPFRTYLFWSWLGMLPGTILYVGGSDAVARSVAGDSSVAVIAVVGIILVLLLVLGRIGRRKLNELDAEAGEPQVNGEVTT